GAVNNSFILARPFSQSSPHWNGTSFFKSFIIGFVSSASPGTNLQRQETLPMRLRSWSWEVGEGICLTAVAFASSADIPSQWTMTPRNFPILTAKAHFFGFIFSLYF